jgi:hypothetical protein
VPVQVRPSAPFFINNIRGLHRSCGPFLVGHWWSTCFDGNVSKKLDHPSPSESPKTDLVQFHPSQNLIPHPKIYVSPKTAVCPQSIRIF